MIFFYSGIYRTNELIALAINNILHLLWSRGINFNQFSRGFEKGKQYFLCIFLHK